MLLCGSCNTFAQELVPYSTMPACPLGWGPIIASAPLWLTGTTTGGHNKKPQNWIEVPCDLETSSRKSYLRGIPAESQSNILFCSFYPSIVQANFCDLDLELWVTLAILLPQRTTWLGFKLLTFSLQVRFLRSVLGSHWVFNTANTRELCHLVFWWPFPVSCTRPCLPFGISI